MHELRDNVLAVKAVTAKSITADEAGAIIDMQGYQSAMFIAHLGSNANFDGSNYIEMVIEHGDASDLSDAAKPGADDILADSYNATSGVWATINSTAKDDAIYSVEYKGNKRYVRITFDVTGTLTGGVPIGGVTLMGKPADMPVDNP